MSSDLERSAALDMLMGVRDERSPMQHVGSVCCFDKQAFLGMSAGDWLTNAASMYPGVGNLLSAGYGVQGLADSASEHDIPGMLGGAAMAGVGTVLASQIRPGKPKVSPGLIPGMQQAYRKAGGGLSGGWAAAMHPGDMLHDVIQRPAAGMLKGVHDAVNTVSPRLAGAGRTFSRVVKAHPGKAFIAAALLPMGLKYLGSKISPDQGEKYAGDEEPSDISKILSVGGKGLDTGDAVSAGLMAGSFAPYVGHAAFLAGIPYDIGHSIWEGDIPALAGNIVGSGVGLLAGAGGDIVTAGAEGAGIGAAAKKGTSKVVTEAIREAAPAAAKAWNAAGDKALELGTRAVGSAADTIATTAPKVSKGWAEAGDAALAAIAPAAKTVAPKALPAAEVAARAAKTPGTKAYNAAQAAAKATQAAGAAAAKTAPTVAAKVAPVVAAAATKKPGAISTAAKGVSTAFREAGGGVKGVQAGANAAQKSLNAGAMAVRKGAYNTASKVSPRLAEAGSTAMGWAVRHPNWARLIAGAGASMAAGAIFGGPGGGASGQFGAAAARGFAAPPMQDIKNVAPTPEFMPPIQPQPLTPQPYNSPKSQGHDSTFHAEAPLPTGSADQAAPVEY